MANSSKRQLSLGVLLKIEGVLIFGGVLIYGVLRYMRMQEPYATTHTLNWAVIIRTWASPAKK